MFLLYEGHMYFVYGLGLLSMFPASESSVRRSNRASKPPAHVAAARGRLAEKTTGVRPPLGSRAEVAEEKVSPLSQFGRIRFPADAAPPPLAGYCLGRAFIRIHRHRTQLAAIYDRYCHNGTHLKTAPCRAVYGVKCTQVF